MNDLQIYHSIIDRHSLALWLQRHYGLAQVQCQLIRLGLNDTYQAQTLQKKYIVRIYRASWRDGEAVAAEMEVLQFLQRHGFPIAAPLPALDQHLIHFIQAPEGSRALVVFEYIEGKALNLDRQQSFTYGQALARLHQITDEFHFSYRRIKLNQHHLLHEPVQHIEQAFGHHQAELHHLKCLAAQAQNIFSALPKSRSIYGFCHGDHFGNVLLNNHQQCVFIDFDCCGLGFRLYDVVQFYWAIHLRIPAWQERYAEANEALWLAFLQGYQQVRPLTALEQAALPAMFIVRTLWGLALQPQNEQHWGIEAHERIWQQNYALLLDPLNQLFHGFTEFR